MSTTAIVSRSNTRRGPDGEERLGEITERAYAPALVRALLREAGFRRVDHWVGRRSRGRDLRTLWIARAGRQADVVR